MPISSPHAWHHKHYYCICFKKLISNDDYTKHLLAAISYIIQLFSNMILLYVSFEYIFHGLTYSPLIMELILDRNCKYELPSSCRTLIINCFVKHYIISDINCQNTYWNSWWTKLSWYVHEHMYKCWLRSFSYFVSY